MNIHTIPRIDFSLALLFAVSLLIACTFDQTIPLVGLLIVLIGFRVFMSSLSMQTFANHGAFMTGRAINEGLDGYSFLRHATTLPWLADSVLLVLTAFMYPEYTVPILLSLAIVIQPMTVAGFSYWIYRKMVRDAQAEIDGK